MKPVVAIIIWSSLAVTAVVLVGSDAWSGCTIEQRIELGKQGYDKGQVEKACSESVDNFWDSLGKDFARDFAKDLEKGLTNGLNKALGANGNNYASSAISGARICSTNYGTCPLSGVPVGYPCYCTGRNGYAITGISK